MPNTSHSPFNRRGCLPGNLFIISSSQVWYSC